MDTPWTCGKIKNDLYGEKVLRGILQKKGGLKWTHAKRDTETLRAAARSSP